MIGEIISYLRSEAAVLLVFFAAAVFFFSRALFNILKRNGTHIFFKRNKTFTTTQQQDVREHARGRL